MSKISCDIIKDMLPLYHDNVCSNDSRKMVEEHLIECNSCKNEFEKMQTDIKISKEDIVKNRSDSNMIKDISVFWNRSKAKAFIKGIIVTAISFTVIFLGYIILFNLNIARVPTDVIEITNVCKLADGKIAYHVELTDGYALRRIKFDMDEDGNFYLIPLRPIIKMKAKPPYTLEKGYDFFDVEGQEMNRDGAEIKAWYYWSAKENILSWKTGMDLPKANEEIEKMFGFQ